MQFDYIIKLLNLQDKNVEIINVEIVDNTYLIHLKVNNYPTCCPNCGSTSIIKHTDYPRSIKYMNLLNFKCIIKYVQKRFLCKDCKKTFNQTVSFVSKHSTIANNLKMNTLMENKKNKSFKDIALESNISDATVHNEFKKSLFDYRGLLTRIICIDEFKASTIAGEYAFVIGDPIGGKIIDILPSRKQDYIYYYFQSIPDEERFKVEYIVTDLFESYKSIAENLFWKSIHIADRFHFIRLATEAFNKTRIRLMHSWEKLGQDEFKGKFNKYTTFANVLKKYHKLFLINPYNREQWFFSQTFEVSYLKETKTIDELIEWCLNLDCDLAEAFGYLRDLYKIAKFSNYENAKKDLLEWCNKIENTKTKMPEFKKVALTYKHWIKPIVNSFIIDIETKTRLTNGFIEGKNNMIKTIKRVGFGFKDFDIFRAKILHIDDEKKPFKN